MKKLWLFLVLTLCTFGYSQTQGLTGSFTFPDATGVNGTFYIGMQGGTFKNICSTPYQVVPTVKTGYKVTNGVLASSAASASFVSSDCMMPRFPYYVAMYDAKNNLLYQDNWYIPRVAGNVVNVGLMAAERMGSSPISVALPIGIVSTPSGSQTITQPSGTSLTINGAVNINGPVTFSSTPSYSQIIAGQILIGGITTSSYKLDVLGIINASQGYAVGGSGGTAGQCLVSNGTAFVPGVCFTPTAQTVFYQSMETNGAMLPQESIVSYDGPFSSSDDSANHITHLALNTLGSEPSVVMGTTAGVNGNCVQWDNFGGISDAGIPCNAHNTTRQVLTGTKFFNTTYQNTNSYALLITGFGATTGGSGDSHLYCGVNGTASSPLNADFGGTLTATSVGSPVGFICIVPANAYYSINVDGNISNYPVQWVQNNY